MTSVAALLDHARMLLSNRPHAAGELAQKLVSLCQRRAKRAPGSAPAGGRAAQCAAAAADVVAVLSREGALDDVQYAAWHVAQRERFRPRSRLQLIRELSVKRVDSAVITASVSASNELHAAAAAAARMPSATDAVLARRLAQRGFGYHTVQKVVLGRTRSSQRNTGLSGDHAEDDEAMK